MYCSSRLEDATEITELLCGQHPADHNWSFVKPPLCADGDGRDIASDDRIVDLVLRGHRVTQRHKNRNHVILDHLLSSDEDENLDDSILTDSSGPMHNKDLLQELLYTRGKDKSDESSVVIPAEAFDSDNTASNESSHSPVLEDRETLQKSTGKNKKEPVCTYSVSTSKVPVRGMLMHKGLGKRGELKDKNILGSIGVDRLTKLGRVNAAKVSVGHVTVIDPSSTGHNQPTKNDRYSIYVFCV